MEMKDHKIVEAVTLTRLYLLYIIQVKRVKVIYLAKKKTGDMV